MLEQERRWSTLMVETQDGNGESYKTLLTEIRQLLAGYISKKVYDQSVVEDIVQEILLALHKAKHTYDPNRSFKTWLFAIAHHKWVDYIRKWRRQGFSESLDDHMFSDESWPLDEMIALQLDMDAVIKTLPQRQQDIIRLMKFEGKSVKETADAMGMGISAVKVTAHRAYKKMKKVIEAGT